MTKPINRFAPGPCNCNCAEACVVPIKTTENCGAAPVSGVVVTATQGTTTVATSVATDGGGNTSLTLSPGTYDLKATKTGCYSYKRTVTVSCPSTTQGLKMWCSSTPNILAVAFACGTAKNCGKTATVTITYPDGQTYTGTVGHNQNFVHYPTAGGTATYTVSAPDGMHDSKSGTFTVFPCIANTFGVTVPLKDPWQCCFDGTQSWIVKPGVLVTLGSMSGYSADSTICQGSICLTGTVEYTCLQPPLVTCTSGTHAGTSVRKKPVHTSGTVRCVVSWGQSAGQAKQTVPHLCYSSFEDMDASCSGPLQYSLLCRAPEVTCGMDNTFDRGIDSSSMVVDGNAGTCALTFPDSYPTSYDPVLAVGTGACPGSSRPISTSCLITQV